MLDAGYDFGQVDPAWSNVVRPTKLPSFHNEFAPSGNVYASVRQTRFGVNIFSPTPLGDLKTVFEFELFGTGVDAGQTTSVCGMPTANWARSEPDKPGARSWT